MTSSKILQATNGEWDNRAALQWQTSLEAAANAQLWYVYSGIIIMFSFTKPGGTLFLTVFSQDDLESLPSLWMALFRVMDDVHDGTRQAAGNTTRILSKVCEVGQDLMRLYSVKTTPNADVWIFLKCRSAYVLLIQIKAKQDKRWWRQSFQYYLKLAFVTMLQRCAQSGKMNFDLVNSSIQTINIFSK